MTFALTIYPLSRGFRQTFEQTLGIEPTYVNLTDLRKLPVPQMLRRLRHLAGDRLLLPLEDDNSRSVLPILKALSGLTSAREIEIVYPDLRSERLHRGDAARAVGRLAVASTAALRDAGLVHVNLQRLRRAARRRAERGQGPVLYVNANLWFGLKAGGSVGHVAGVVNGLRATGHQVTYASVGGSTSIRPDVAFTPLPVPSAFGFPYELNHYRVHRLACRHLAGTRQNAMPEFIYQRMSVGNYAGVSLSRLWGRPLVIEYNGSEVWIARNWGKRLRFEQLALAVEDVNLRHAHVVVTISDALKDELIERGVDPNRIVCYPNCVDPDVFDPARFTAANSLALRERLALEPDAVVATFVGTFGQWHGAENLARAIARLVAEQADLLRRLKLRFLLVGDGVRMPQVTEILNEACHEFVVLTGLVPQADAPAYLAASDVLLSPHVANADGSRFFGSPTKLFEYMAMGKAIIASDLDQIGEVLRPGLRVEALPTDRPCGSERALAVLTPPGDEVALGRALVFAAANPAWGAQLGRNAREAALRRYTWRRHVEAILEAVTRMEGE